MSDGAGGSTFYQFPEGSVECAPRDYLICGPRDARWSVYRVDDILLVKRLMPRLTPPASLVAEEDVLDSMTPAYFREVQFLVTAFDPDFADESAARHAIARHELHERAHGLLRAAREFPQTQCRVFRPAAER